MKFQKLFNHLAEEHELILLESEMQEIENILNRSPLKDRYQKIVKDYINAFCDKQGCDFEFWVSDIIGGVACFRYVFFDFHDIVFDIDTRQKRGLIFEWYDEQEELDYNISYRTFTKLKR